jgi:hypothetical protein
MKKKAGISEDPTELRERFHMMLNQRIQNDVEFRDLFANAYTAMRKGDQSKMKKLFVQHAAVVTQAPNLTPDLPKPSLADPDPYGPGQPASTSVGEGGKLLNSAITHTYKPKKLKMSKTAAVDAWFEKNAKAFYSEAQLRYPELLLLKTSSSDTQKVPVSKTIKPKGTGPVGTPPRLGAA